MEKEFKGETRWRLLLSLETPGITSVHRTVLNMKHTQFLSPLSEVRLDVSRHETHNSATSTIVFKCESLCFAQIAQSGRWKKMYLTVFKCQTPLYVQYSILQ